MRALLLFFCLFACISFLLSQEISHIQSYTYGTGDPSSPYYPDSPNETIHFVLPTSDGGYLLVGEYLFDDGNVNGVIRKVSATGDRIAASVFSSPLEDVGRAAVEYNGYYYVTGSFSYHNSEGEFLGVDCYIGVYDENLNRVNWTTYFFDQYGYEHFVGTSIIVVGNELLIGGTAKANEPNPFPSPPATQGAIFKINPTTLNITDEEIDIGTSVFKLENTNDNSFYVFGEYFNNTNESCTEVYDGPYTITIVGDISYQGGYYSDVYARKFTYSLNNAPGWSTYRLIGGRTPDTYIDAIATDDGGFAILGYTDCESDLGNTGPNNVCFESGFFRNYWLYKGSSSGIAEWDRSIDGVYFSSTLEGPFGILSSCNGEDIILGELKLVPGVNPTAYIWTQFNGGSGTTSDIGVTYPGDVAANDLKRGLNNEIVVGGRFDSFLDQDHAFVRQTSDPCFNLCDLAIPVTCGELRSGDTRSSTNNVDITNFACYEGAELSFLAGDDVYSYHKSTSSSDLIFYLYDANTPLEINIVYGCDNDAQSCVTDNFSRRFSNNKWHYVWEDAPAGTYYIVIDAINPESEGPYTLSVTCEELNCNSGFELECGETYFHSTTGFSNTMSRYCGVTGFTGGAGCTGPERLYWFDVTRESDVELNLQLSSNIDLELFLFNSCDFDNCFELSTNQEGVNENISATLSPGRYYVVVDGWEGAQGGYALNFECCADPEITDTQCEAINYAYVSGLTYSLNYAEANYASTEDWLINGTYYSNSNGGGYIHNFFTPGTYQVCAPYYNTDGCIDYCCRTYCIEDQPDCLNGLIGPCPEECACIDQSEYLPAPFQCESFASYPYGDFAPNGTAWSSTAGNAEIRYNPSEAGAEVFFTKELYINNNNGNRAGPRFDVRPMQDLSCGRYRISFGLTVDDGRSAEFFLSATSGGSSLYTVSFNADGTGRINGSNSFVYLQQEWLTITLIVDLDQNKLEYWLNGDLVHTTSYFSNLGGLGFSDNFGNGYAIDNICLRTRKDNACSAGGPQACVENGERYANVCEAATIGLYSEDELEICLSVCDFVGTTIGRSDGIPIPGRLEAYEQAPNLMYEDPDIVDELTAQFGSSPYPLYTDFYTFVNESSGQIIVDVNPNVLAFVWRCDCNDMGCAPQYIGPAGNLGIQPEGQYYIVVVGDTPGQDYTIEISPGSPCQVENRELVCNDMISGNFTGADNTFSASQNNLPDCYAGASSFEGRDRVYRLFLETAAVVNITLNTNDGSGGMFLFSSACGGECLDYSETSPVDGQANIVALPLGQGYYYLLIDESNSGGIASFSLSTSCATDDGNTVYSVSEFDLECETNNTQNHEVRLNFNGVLAANAFGPNTRFKPGIRPSTTSSLDLANIAMAPVLFNNRTDNIIVFPNLEEYAGSTPESRCAYLPGDSITMIVETDAGPAVYRPVWRNTPEFNNRGVFTPTTRSEIIDLQLMQAPFAISLDNRTITFNAADSRQLNRLWGLNNDEEAGVEWAIRPSDPEADISWLFTNPVDMLSSSYTGQQRIFFRVAENTTFQEREARLYWFTRDPYLTKPVTIRQKARCETPILSLTGAEFSPENEIVVCAGESINIQANYENTNVPDDLYEFIWEGPGIAVGGRTLTLNNTTPGLYTYTLTATQTTCSSASATETITVRVQEAPSVPEVEQAAIFDCGQGATFRITSPQAGVEYEWSNSSGVIRRGTELSFDPPSPGDYFVRAIRSNDQDCTSASRSLTYSRAQLTVNLQSSSDQREICVGETLQLTAETNLPAEQLNFQWDFSPTTNGPIATYVPQTVGSETLRVTVSNGQCTPVSSTLTITALAPPTTPLVMSQIFCADGTYPELEVTNATGMSISWFADVNGSNVLESGPSFLPSNPPAARTTFWVQSSNEVCNSSLVPVEYFPIPPISLSLEASTIPVCTRELVPLNLSIGGGRGEENISLNWSGNVSTQSDPPNFVAPGMAGTYPVRVNATDGYCTDSASLSFTVVEPPRITAQSPTNNFTNIPDDLACADDLETYSIGFTIEGGTLLNTSSYPGDLMGGPAYTLSNIPRGSDFELVFADPNETCVERLPVRGPECNCPVAPSPVAQNLQYISCEGSALPLMTVNHLDTVNYDIQWLNEAGDVVGNGTVYRPSSMPVETRLYTVRAINKAARRCMSDGIQVEYIRVPALTVVLTGESTICAGSEISLTTETMGGYDPAAFDYNWNNNLGQTRTVRFISDVGTQTYSVSVTDPNSGCASTASLNVNGIAAPPAPTFTRLPDCAPGDDSYTFTFTSTADLVTLAGDSPGVLTPLGEGNFEVTAPVNENVVFTLANTEGGIICAAESVQIIAPNCDCPAVPNASVPGNGEIVDVCIGQETQASLVVQPPGGGYEVRWYQDATLRGDYHSGPTYRPGMAGTYYAVVYTTDGNCTSSLATPVTLRVNPLPVTEIGFTDTVVCRGAALQLNGGQFSSGAAPLRFSWNGNALFTNEVIPNPVLTPQEAVVNIRLRVEDSKGCISEDAATILTTSPPAGQIELLDEVSCYGDSTGSLMASYTSDYPPVSYNWSTGAVTTAIYDLPAGSYRLTSTDDIGCISRDTFPLTSPTDLELADTTLRPIEVSTGIPDLAGSIQVVMTGGTPPYAYTWRMGNTFVSAADSVVSTVSGIYQLLVTDANDCTWEGSFELDLIVDNDKIASLEKNIRLFPNPTTGRLNLAVEIPQVQELDLVILDALGKIVIQQHNVRIDGGPVSIDTEQLPAGIYWLQLQLDDDYVSKRFLKLAR